MISSILIDDDELVREAWDMSAKRNGKSLETFSTPEQFFARVGEFDQSAPIYIDSTLANGIKGEDVAKQIYCRISSN